MYNKLIFCRYVILYEFGGVYLDMDDCCRTSLEPLVREMEQNNQSILLPLVKPWGTGNDVMISTKANTFLNYSIQHLSCTDMRFFIPYLTVLKSTGTVYLSDRRVEYQRLYPNFRFRLLGVDERAQVYIFREKGSTWHRLDGKIIVHVYTNLYAYLSITTAAVWMSVLLRNKRTLKWRRKLSLVK